MSTTQLSPLKGFVLQKCTIKTHNDQYIDLSSHYVELNLCESIFSPVVYGDIVIVDMYNFISYGPLIGGEELELILHNVHGEKSTNDNKSLTPQELDIINKEGNQKKDNVLSYTFSLLSIEGKEIAKNRTQVYKIKFCSKEAIINQQIRISTTFLNKAYSRIANNILFCIFKEIEKLSPNERKDVKGRKSKQLVTLNTFSDSHEPQISIHFPNQHPFECMTYLTGKAFSNEHPKGNPYFFYESLDRFFYFGSYRDHFYFDYTKGEKLSVDKISNKGNKVIIYTNKQLEIDDSSAIAFPHAAIEFYGMTDHLFPKDFDFLENIKKGVYANKLLTYDYTTKKIKKYEYDYVRNYSTVPRIYKDVEKGLMLSKGAPEYKSPYYPESFIKTVFTQDQSFLKGKTDSYPQHTKNYRFLKLQELNNNYLKINMPGDISMYCGKFYDVYLNSPDVSTSEKLKADPHFCGTYFCLRIRHCFKPENYTTALELSKDSFMEETLQTFPQAEKDT